MLSQVPPLRLILAFVFPLPLKAAHVMETDASVPNITTQKNFRFMTFAPSKLEISQENCEIQLDLQGGLESFLECARICFVDDITWTMSLYYVCKALFKLTLFIENFKSQVCW